MVDLRGPHLLSFSFLSEEACSLLFFFLARGGSKNPLLLLSRLPKLTGMGALVVVVGRNDFLSPPPPPPRYSQTEISFSPFPLPLFSGKHPSTPEQRGQPPPYSRRRRKTNWYLPKCHYIRSFAVMHCFVVGDSASPVRWLPLISKTPSPSPPSAPPPPPPPPPHPVPELQDGERREAVDE